MFHQKLKREFYPIDDDDDDTCIQIHALCIVVLVIWNGDFYKETKKEDEMGNYLDYYRNKSGANQMMFIVVEFTVVMLFTFLLASLIVSLWFGERWHCKHKCKFGRQT